MKKTIFLIILPLSSIGQTTGYKYDKVGRLVETQYTPFKKINYTYDKDGNRIQKVETVLISVGISDSIKTNVFGLTIFPNPSTGLFNGSLNIKKSQNVLVQVISLNGNVVHSFSFDAAPGLWQFTFNISPISPGTYQVISSGSDFRFSEKIQIVK